MNTFLSFSNLESFLIQRETIRLSPTSAYIKEAYSLLYAYLGDSSTQFIQILGTNGKGSTTTYLEALALEHSSTVGIFTSPHFISIRERIRCNGATLSEQEWLEAALCIESLIDTTFLLTFEYLLLIALYLFHKYAVSLAILEAGLGGIYDSTSILSHSIHVFTRIDLDHQHILGSTVHDIALQKISAIQKNTLCASVPQHEDITPILQKITNSQNTELFYSDISCAYSLALAGKFQEENASLALLAYSLFLSLSHRKCKEHCVQNAFKKAFISGRAQHIQMHNNTILLDGAHNNNSLLALKEYTKTLSLSYIIFSTKYKSNLAEYLSILHSFHIPTLYVPIIAKHMLSFDDVYPLAPFLLQYHSLEEALLFALNNTKESQTILITGSLYLLGTFFSLYPQFLRTEYT